MNDNFIEGGFLSPYNYFNCQGLTSSRRFSCLFRLNTKALHRIALQVINNSFILKGLCELYK